MKDYTVSTEPVFSEKIKIVETTDPVHADHANAAAKQLIENDVALKKILDKKVDEEEGKGLSSNDYTNQDKKAVNGMNGLSFGQDSEGNWGYIPPGADTVVPFSEGGSLPDNVRIIELQAVPLAGGTVKGGGMVSDGMTITIEAEPDKENNFIFEGWKESGAIVCEELQFTFPVSADRSLIAEFLEVQYTLGADWWYAPMPKSDENWKSVTYGNGKFVAICYYSDDVAYSVDGITWTLSWLPSSDKWTSVTYGDGKFVAICYGGNKAAYSIDGIVWTRVTLSVSADWQAVIYGNGKFVAVSYGNHAAYSIDGITWTNTVLPSSTNWASIAYGNGKFITVGYNLAAYSIDGITWTKVTLPTSEWKSVAYGNGKFVTVGTVGYILYSVDGITWSEAAFPGSLVRGSIAYGQGKFVIVTSTSTKNAAYSVDGITWTEVTLPEPEDGFSSSAKWSSVTYGNGKFVAVGYTKGAICSSAKGPGK